MTGTTNGTYRKCNKTNTAQCAAHVRTEAVQEANTQQNTKDSNALRRHFHRCFQSQRIHSHSVLRSLQDCLISQPTPANCIFDFLSVNSVDAQLTHTRSRSRHNNIVTGMCLLCRSRAQRHAYDWLTDTPLNSLSHSLLSFLVSI